MNVSPRSGRAAVLLLVPFVILLGVALTASTGVPASRADRHTESVTANELKPSACASIALVGIRVGSGTFSDTASANLVLGSAGADTIRGRGGSDCIVGGAGGDSLRGDGGTDVCIGGPGADTFHASCETQIQ